MLKIDIAKEYLADSLRLYSEGRFFSALTLAGAAEEMLGKAVRHRSVSLQSTATVSLACNAEDCEVQGDNAFDAQFSNTASPPFVPQSEKEVRDRLHLPRNAAKHFNNPAETFQFNAKFEAGSMLIRAIHNHRLVFPSDDSLHCEEETIAADQLCHVLPGP